MIQYIKIVVAVVKLAVSYLQQKPSKKNLRFHPVFMHLNRTLHSEIPALRASDPTRTAIYRDMLDTLFRAVRTRLQELVTHPQLADWSSEQTQTALIDCLHAAQHDYEIQVRRMGVPWVAVEKVRHQCLSEWDMVMAFMEGICNSPVYYNNTDRVYACLTAFDSLCVLTLVRMIDKLYLLNGELDGMQYRGGVCLPNPTAYAPTPTTK